MNKIKVAIVGFGNVGAMALESVINEPDMEFVGCGGYSRKSLHYFQN
jgi:glyceraldehyde-3-phosphate dehydrogenase/erythrose-4-phosphate dehydrogenase